MMFDNSYKTIDKPSLGIFKDRGSKFLGFVFPVKTESNVKSNLNEIKKEHHKANHHCYAFRLGASKNTFRFSDDREPAGSAGKPIYGAIQSNDLTNVLIVVARYFGGTLLGVPGLINAYRSAAQDAVTNATVIEKAVTEKYELQFAYELLNQIMPLVKTDGVIILNQNFETNCKMQLEINKSAADKVLKSITGNYLLKDKIVLKVLE